MSAPTPSWYDLLGVSPDASADEIRAAWRSRIADLDPTDRRFAVLNQAAEVLLDPQARTAYDAELAPEPEPKPAPVTAGETPPTPPTVSAAAPRRRPGVPGWVLATVAALTLVVAGAAVAVAATQPSDRSVEDGTEAARAAAERAVGPVLSYDAKHLDESKAAAEPYLTGDYQEQYDKLFDGVIAQNAPSTGTVLKAEALRSGIVRSGDDRVQVFVLVNQTRTNKASKQPVVYKNWVTVTMQKVDGDWLVAGMDT
ncbi:J domain-containing protein [Nocardioides mangrovi]|uniref:J domain-containing protein n=1 Tax=Nocardioides mangrovi TaxID=2874580 RepID=A0ABS7UIC7_9ACTN|nr:J domain-containing protein [Nocardioides mangrovi]MBZ5740537.1 J domain-containing protein [Nocardioides mangrovi]